MCWYSDRSYNNYYNYNYNIDFEKLVFGNVKTLSVRNVKGTMTVWRVILVVWECLFVEFA